MSVFIIEVISIVRDTKCNKIHTEGFKTLAEAQAVIEKWDAGAIEISPFHYHSMDNNKITKYDIHQIIVRK